MLILKIVTCKIIVLFIGSLLCMFITPYLIVADTIDVWFIKRNNEIIFRSNQMLIVHKNEPMQINLYHFSDNDTIKICYWTDGGGEDMKWHFILKDSNDYFLDKFTNAIDSSIRCYPTPCNEFIERKNFIPFIVKDLKKLMNEKKVDKLFIQFEHIKSGFGEPYRNRKVCIISTY